MYPRRDAVESANIPGETLLRPAESYSWRPRITQPGGSGLHHQRKGKILNIIVPANRVNSSTSMKLVLKRTS